MEGHVLIWEVTNADTAVAGNGTVELMGLADGKKKLSAITKTYIRATTTGATTAPPDSARPWVDQVLEAAERAEAAAERAESAGGSGGSGGGIVTETDPTVHDWAKQPQKPTYTADEVNAIGKDALPQAIEAALAQAKESGEFDGAQGEPGKSGVHIGPDEPTDPNVNVWVNPKGDGKYIDDTLTQAGKAADARSTGEAIDKLRNEKADKTEIPEPYMLPVATADKLGGVKVGEGLTMDGEALGVEPENEYELIETITIAEDGIVQVSRASEPNGTPYNFKKVVVKNKIMPAGKADALNVWFNNDVQVCTISTGAHATSTIYSSARAWKENGVLMCQAANGSVAIYGVIATYGMSYGRSVVQTKKNIEKVRFIYATEMNIPVGSTFEIWGVRA